MLFEHRLEHVVSHLLESEAWLNMTHMRVLLPWGISLRDVA